MLISEGVQLPKIPLSEVVGSKGAVVPSQNGGIVLKFGIVNGVIFVLIVIELAQMPVLGVKV